jgi:hypothetical protein
MGGAEAASSLALASSDTSEQEDKSALPVAKLMAKARHVGTPHLPQLVLGSNLKISIPDKAMCFSADSLIMTPALGKVILAYFTLLLPL